MSFIKCRECGYSVKGIEIGAKLVLMVTFLVFLFPCACSTDEPSVPAAVMNPVYSTQLSSGDRQMAEKAFGVFCDACQPLMGKYASDIEKMEISEGFSRDPKWGCMDYRCRDYEWDKEIYIQVKIKDDTKVIPSDLRAWGHTLHFYLGGPKNPGITTSKIPELCGASRKDGRDAYISVPELSFIK